MRSAEYISLVLLTISLVKGIPFPPEDETSDKKEIIARDIGTCYLWYWSQPNPDSLLAKTLKPPCSISAAFPPTLPGGWTTDPGCDASQQPNTCNLHKGAYGCYRHALSSTGPGAQACYDKNGQWISDPWKGAGTLDAETPLGDTIQAGKHFVADVVPYYDCCKLTLFFQKHICNLYYEKRPPGQCQN
ncbi:unnamed protein product [Rotaria sp. Silwood2]|nr:unnamed protein product [Rotaria sp. Silwood2]